MTNEERRTHPYYSQDHKFLTWAKKDDKKKEIKAKQEELQKFILNINPKAVETLSPEELKTFREENKKTISKLRMEISALQDQLKELQANKLGSKAFEVSYTPPNRRMKKQARKLSRK
jgi:septal ring factor EnvC (AmiA/AmiB activator)